MPSTLDTIARSQRTNALAGGFYDQPLTYRSSMLPLGTYQNEDGTESAGFAWPELFRSAGEAAEVPGRLMSGDPEQGMTSDDLHRTAMNAAGLMMGGGLVAPRPGNALAMGGGRRVVGDAAAVVEGKGPGFDGWHGSPHDFDRFSMDHIGNGEGAQAFGHGLYFADKPGVASFYRGGQFLNQKPVDQLVSSYMAYGKGDIDQALAAVGRDMELAKRHPTGKPHAEALERLTAMKTGQAPTSPGYLYQARINADPEHFLDWDKPLSAQSDAVRSALSNSSAYKTGLGSAEDFLKRLESGESIFPATPERLNEARLGVSEYGNTLGGAFVRDLPFGDGSRQLGEAGIPGIRYLDQGSRSAGEGSRNYVVFDDNLLDILHKWRGDEQLYSGGLPAPLPPQRRNALSDPTVY